MRDIEIISIGHVNGDHDPPIAEPHIKVVVENLWARELEAIDVTIQVAWEHGDSMEDTRAKVLEETRSVLRNALNLCETTTEADLGKELLAPVALNHEMA